MSRGPGKIETAVLEAVRRLAAASTNDIVRDVFNIADDVDLTPSQLGSVQRALRRLKRRGEVAEYVPPRASIWRLAPARRRYKLRLPL